VAPLDQHLGALVPDERIHVDVDPQNAPAVALFGGRA
jgi:hypothetical protein